MYCAQSRNNQGAYMSVLFRSACASVCLNGAEYIKAFFITFFLTVTKCFSQFLYIYKLIPDLGLKKVSNHNYQTHILINLLGYIDTSLYLPDDAFIVRNIYR